MAEYVCVGCGTEFEWPSDADEHLEQSPPAHFLKEKGEDDQITRTRGEIEARLERLREYEPASSADHNSNQAAIRHLEWVLSPDEAAEEVADG